MGIRDLWLVNSSLLLSFRVLKIALLQAVSPASQVRTLTHIAVTEGFELDRHRMRCLFIGIDARCVCFTTLKALTHLFSIWMNEAQMAIQVTSRLGHGTRVGENPALRVLFYRLCRLLTLPIVPIFVFDGPDRPKLKRGTNVKTKPHWLSTPLRKFIEAFGFYWYMVSITTCCIYLFLIVFYSYRLLQKLKLILLN